jgi:hypothetical protein
MKKICLFIPVISVFLSCRSGETHGNAKADSTLLGYWIPEKINWKSPHSGSPEIDTVVRSAYLNVLHFDPPNRFSVFVTTVNYPKRYDSLIFEYEPGVDIYCGTWRDEGGKMIVNYRFVYSGYEKKPNEAAVVDTAQAGTGGTLLFDKVRYVRTTFFDAASLKKIEAYRVEAGMD